jgi:hypothetical protein
MYSGDEIYGDDVTSGPADVDHDGYCPYCHKELIDLGIPESWPYCTCEEWTQNEELACDEY